MHKTLLFALKQLPGSRAILIFLGCLLWGITKGQAIDSLPLFEMGQLKYIGAFRLPAEEFGASSLNYSEGPIEYNEDHHSMFIVGHSHHQAIAEFSIPPLALSEDIQALPMAGPPLQVFQPFLFETPDSNPQDIDRIGGMEYVGSESPPQLVVNGYEYYDAPGDNTLTTFRIMDANDLGNSSLSQYFYFEGGAGHTSGWISPIPDAWQSILDGTHLTGESSGIPIISRTSVGPSAFSFYLDSLLVTDSGNLSTTKLLDFSLQNPLHNDLSNDALNNDIWTHLSRVVYGFIVPGTRTYLTIGYSGGHQSGVCYKCTQNDGHLCGGYCAPDTADYYQYYWLWDLMDLKDVKEGNLGPHEVEPYDYGAFVTPFQNETKQIGGASFDEENQILYLSIQKADRAQGTYSNPPVIVAYSWDQILSVDVVLERDHIMLYPNPTQGIFEISGPLQEYAVEIQDVTGQVYKKVDSNAQLNSIVISDLPAGLYFVHIRNAHNHLLSVEKILKH